MATKRKRQGRRKRRFKRITNSKHDGPIAPNLLARDFTETELNRAWVTDVTAIATDEGWLYLAVVLDLFSRRVVGWATSSNNDTTLALDALQAALKARKPGRVQRYMMFAPAYLVARRHG